MADICSVLNDVKRRIEVREETIVVRLRELEKDLRLVKKFKQNAENIASNVDFHKAMLIGYRNSLEDVYEVIRKVNCVQASSRRY